MTPDPSADSTPRPATTVTDELRAVPDGVYRSDESYWMVRHWWDDVPPGWSRRWDADSSHEVFAVLPPTTAATGDHDDHTIGPARPATPEPDERLWHCYAHHPLNQCTGPDNRHEDHDCGWRAPAPAPAVPDEPGERDETPNAPTWVHAVTPAAIVGQRAAGWPDFHPEDFCHRCGRRNPVWWCAFDVWSEVFPDHAGIVCPSCFAESYKEVHPRAMFELSIDDRATAVPPAPAAAPLPRQDGPEAIYLPGTPTCIAYGRSSFACDGLTCDRKNGICRHPRGSAPAPADESGDS